MVHSSMLQCIMVYYSVPWLSFALPEQGYCTVAPKISTRCKEIVQPAGRVIIVFCDQAGGEGLYT